MDEQRIDYGPRWPQVIQEQVDRCTAFAVVITSGIVGVGVVQIEFTHARGLRKPIFPLQLEADYGWRWRRGMYVDVRGAKLRRRASILAFGRSCRLGRRRCVHLPAGGNSSR